MYHRVATLDVDPWGLAVDEEHFAAQLDHLTQRWKPMAIDRLLDGRRRFPGERRPVAVTFDDGYVDNLERALPILERFEVPATIFITTGAVDDHHGFWWDRLEEVFLVTADLPAKLPADVATVLEGTVLEGGVSEGRVTIDPATLDTSARHELFQQVWQALYRCQPAERTTLTETLCSWAGLEARARPTHRTVTATELRTLADHPLVSCQAHSVSHAPLPTLSAGDQAAELKESKAALEAMIDSQVVGFAYPHGHTSAETRQLAAAAGYRYACTTTTGPLRHRADRFSAPRCAVGDWGSKEFEARLGAWWRGDR